MKRNKKTEQFSSQENKSNNSFLRILNQFYSGIGSFCFDMFQTSNGEQDSLEIVYANIRV